MKDLPNDMAPLEDINMAMAHAHGTWFIVDQVMENIHNIHYEPYNCHSATDTWWPSPMDSDAVY